MSKERTNFEQRFDTQETEIFVLTMNYVGAGFVGGKEHLWSALHNVIACADQTDLIPYESTPYLTWLMNDEQCNSIEKIFNLKDETIYKLKVRESLPNGKLSRGRSLLVVDVPERECHHPALEKEPETFRNPVSFFLEGFGEMCLDKQNNTFCGETVWNGENCSVFFDCDTENPETAETASKTACTVLADCKNWDEKARKHAAYILAEDATEWKRDSDEFADVAPEDIPPISEEEFAKRLSISELCFSANGNFTFYYNDDDMFWGHVIIVYGNLQDGITDAEMAG